MKQEDGSFFFDDIFHDLTEEARFVNIKYSMRNKKVSEFGNSLIHIVNVNHHSNFSEYQSSIANLSQDVFKKIIHTLSSLSTNEQKIFLDGALTFIRKIKTYVSEGYYHFNSPYDSFQEPACFKYFTNYQVTDYFDNRVYDIKELVLFTATKYPEFWLSSIVELYDNIESIYKNLIFTITSVNAIENTSIPPAYKFSTSFSVEEMAFFFRLLAEEKFIKVDFGKKQDYCRLITSIFSSKRKPDIALDSFRHKYDEIEIPTVANVIKILDKLSLSAKSFIE